ncbi:MAG TPA: alpha/beta hydrolase [Candidatus Kryptonia bacterium]|nr:alpha/beta hydrolase [Candidatus Kryptonia bacterium]
MERSRVADEFATKHFVDVGHARVCYRKAGDGPALVFLHGFPLSGLTWRKVVPELAPRFTCYALDLMGLGDSTSPDDVDLTSPGQGALFQRALSELAVSSYALLGNDTGGWIARELALLDLGRVTHLALMNTEIPGHRPPWIPLYQRSVGLPGANFFLRRMLASRRLRRSAMGFGGCFANLDVIDGEFCDLFLAPLLSSSDRLTSMRRFLMNMNFERLDRFRELHGKLTMPVAFLWAAADPTFPEPTARAMTSQFPNVAHFWSIPKGKLFVQEEQPDAVAKLVIEFLSGAA